MLAITNDTFDPVLLSIPENEFVREHVGKPPKVIERIVLPRDVNPRAVMPVFQAAYDALEIEKHDHVPWAGVEAIKAAIDAYLAHHAESAELKRRGGKSFPRWPSMAAWDGRGRHAMGGTGSDAMRVRTTFGPDGERVPLAIDLHPSGMVAVKPRWIKSGEVYDALVVDEAKGFMQCPICGHAENFDVDTPSARNAAYARMGKHMTGAKDKPDQHRELHLKVRDRR